MPRISAPDAPRRARTSRRLRPFPLVSIRRVDIHPYAAQLLAIVLGVVARLVAKYCPVRVVRLQPCIVGISVDDHAAGIRMTQ